jgi:hypothetical protein
MPHRRALRRLALTVVLALGTTLLFALVLRDAARTPSQQVPAAAVATLTPVGHQTYSFVLRFPSQDASWHLGQLLVFTWVPQFTDFTMAQRPSAVQCTLAFYGPFPTDTAARAQLTLLQSDQPTTPPTLPAFAPAPVLINDWTSQPQTMRVTVPITLVPGYYVILDHAANALHDSMGGLIVSITAG